LFLTPLLLLLLSFPFVLAISKSIEES
jgi:hypothetical protein